MSTRASSSGSVLFGATRQAVLALLFCHPDEQFHLRQVARRTGCGLGAVQRELKRLTDAGILTCGHRGNQRLFQANAASPVFGELKGLMVKTAGVADVLREALRPLAGRIVVAFIYGSFARGEYDRSSDIDVMVVGNVSFADVVSALSPQQDRLSREINPTVYPVDEFREKSGQGHYFIANVLRNPKIYLVGSEHELGSVAPKRLVAPAHA